MSDTPWAKAFREKLAKQPSEGGFTGKFKLSIILTIVLAMSTLDSTFHATQYTSLFLSSLRQAVLSARSVNYKRFYTGWPEQVSHYYQIIKNIVLYRIKACQRD